MAYAISTGDQPAPCSVALHYITATISLPQTYDYNLQYQNASTLLNIPNKRTVNSPTLSDALYNQSSDFRYLLDKTVRKNEYSEFLKYVPDRTIMNKMCIKNEAEVFFYLNVTKIKSKVHPATGRGGPRCSG